MRTRLALGFVLALGACTGSSDVPCATPPGCASRGACCDERTACRQTLCQGLIWICEPSASGGHRWQQGTTSAACPEPPAPDFGPDRGQPDRGVDLARDLDVDSPTPDAAGQGRSCSAGDVSFEVDPGLAACTKPKIIARSVTPYAWIGCGVEAPTGTIHWDTAPRIEKEGQLVKWTFTPQVPCEPGPYELHFIADATEGNVALGKIVASCTP